MLRIRNPTASVKTILLGRYTLADDNITAVRDQTWLSVDIPPGPTTLTAQAVNMAMNLGEYPGISGVT